MGTGLDRESCANCAAECRRLAGLATEAWVRGELMRLAAFYDQLKERLPPGRNSARSLADGAVYLS